MDDTVSGNISASPDRPSVAVLEKEAVPRLQRDTLNLFEVISGTLANIAPAASLFLTLTLVVAAMGIRAPWAFLVGGVAILATGNSLAEFAKYMPSAGSYISNIGNGFGAISRWLGSFLAGVAFYLTIVAAPITLVGIEVFLGSWVSSLFHWAMPWQWLAVALVGNIVVVILLLRGVVLSSKAAFILFLVEAVGLLILSIGVMILAPQYIGAPLHDGGGSPGGFAGLAGGTLALVAFGYVGWEHSGALAEELKYPHRNIPIAIFSSIAVIAIVFVVSSWGAVVGFVAWLGPTKGINLLGNPSEVNPFLDMTNHFMPWLDWLVGLIGITSALGCYLAAVNALARIVFNGAREKLLPSLFVRVSSKAKTPYMTIFLVTALCVLLMLAFYFLFNGDPVLTSAYAAGIGSVPLLVVYGLMNIALPIYILKKQYQAFNVFKHVLVPVVGTLIVFYGIYQFVQPNQPPPSNTFWIYIAALIIAALVGTTIVLVRNPEAIKRIGSVLAD
jgi:amino acid transporter